jgi:tetratricopeptide (TPR) repeat protein
LAFIVVYFGDGKVKTMSRQKSKKIYPIIIFAFAFLQYLNTIGNDFAWDDKIVIQENERVQEGVSGIPDLFKKYSSQLRQDKYGYRPITLTTFAIDYTLFGENPAGYHFMSVLYFSLLCLVLFFVLMRIFQNYDPLLPFLITMLFAAHPLHVEVVANIKSRDELLAMLFGFASLFYFLKFYSNGKWKHLVFCCVLFILAFLSRENAFTYLAIFPLGVLIQENFRWKKFLKASAILPVLGIVALLILNYALSSDLSIERTEGLGVYEEHFILGNSFYDNNNPGLHIANLFQLNFLYVKNFFVPYPLSYYHGYGDIEILEVHWKTISGTIITLFLLGFSILKFKKYPVIAFGILFYFTTVSVYMHILRKLADTFADRFAFAPSLGLTIALVGFLALLFKIKLKKKKEENSETVSNLKFGSLPILFRGIFIVALIVLSVMTFSRNKVWQDDFTLVSHDLPNLENSARPHYYYASLLNERLQKQPLNSALEKEMILNYEKSMAISDEIYYGRLELASYYADNDRLDDAISLFSQMVILFPEASDPRHFLGKAYVQKERWREAVIQLEKSVEFAPKSQDSRHLLAISYAKVGQYDKALETAEENVATFPEFKYAYYEELGHIYYDKGDLKASAINTIKLLDHGGNPFDVYATVIGRYQSKNDTVTADLYYQQAINLGIMKAEPQ